MPEQIDLFPTKASQHPDIERHPPVGAGHPDTSYAAAESVAGTPAQSARQRVYDFLVEQGTWGATDEHIAELLNMNPSTERPRRQELEQAGRIRKAEWLRTTRSGRKATVWVAT